MNECSCAPPGKGQIFLGIVAVAVLIAIALQAPEIARYVKSSSM